MNEDNLKAIEDKLWASADKMRWAVSVSDYKFIILWLIFLKYISDSFEERYKELVEEWYWLQEERDCYTEKNIFFVPKEARWSYLVENSKASNIGEIIDSALTLIEKDNPTLKNVLPKNYNTPTMRNVNLWEIIDLFTNIKIWTKEAVERDILWRIYEYFLGQFAKNELQKWGEFYTPACLVRTMVEMIEPYAWRVYDPACGSGWMFVQSLKFVQDHQWNLNNISIYWQEKNPTTWRLAKMNLAIRSLQWDLGNFAADTFTEDLHKTLKADFVLANPPFNLEWDRDKVEKDPRWQYWLPPKTNANYAWIQHMVSKLSQNGKMSCILANGSLSAWWQEWEIRQKLIEADLVDCILSMPANLFYTVTVPCSIWVINRNKKQKGKILFIDASKMGEMVTRRLRELSKEDIQKIAWTYHDYQNNDNFEDVLWYVKKADLEEIRENDYVLTPWRYVWVEWPEDDWISFEEKMKTLTEELSQQMEESNRLDEEIKKVLWEIWYNV